jgi:hypothetical protein
LLVALAAASPAQAQCELADRCSATVCAQRQSGVHGPASCDAPFSCRQIPAGDKAELTARLEIARACLAARESVARCFSSGDHGHAIQLQQVRRAVRTCESKLASTP